MKATDFFPILSGERRSMASSILRGELWLASLVYRAVVAMRNAKYDVSGGLALPTPVISVGNITTGGTGKTPMVAYVARRLQAMGAKPAVLMRGYRSTATGSDEAKELRSELGDGVSVEVNPDRVRGATDVLSRHAGVSAFILDDGFQHRRVRRDADLVLIDAMRPFGFDHVLPRGLLREPVKNLRRATATIITRADQVDGAALDTLTKRIVEYAGKPPLATAAHDWAGVREKQAELGLDTLAPLAVVGVCGIGNPRGFETTLKQSCGELVSMHAFADHHDFTAADLRTIADLALVRRADAVVMTEKDWVKCEPIVASIADFPRVLRPVLRMTLLSGAAALDELLRATIRRAV